VLSWQIGQAMKKRHLTKSAMAARMKTNRSQPDRLLDPDQRRRVAGEPGARRVRDRQSPAHRAGRCL
jgi:hypothetical protein